MKPKIVKNEEGTMLHSLGDNLFVKYTGEDTDGQFALIQQQNIPGTGLPPHLHENEDELFKVVQGQVKFSLGNDEYVLNAGDSVFCPRGVAHAWQVTGTEDARVDLTIVPAGLEKMFAEISQIENQKENMDKLMPILAKYKISMIH